MKKKVCVGIKYKLYCTIIVTNINSTMLLPKPGQVTHDSNVETSHG